ncbi:MAG TPA: hypothetical protein VNV38_12965 [Stellaceae bacterium]|jgi:hypothetical protein|nr:hypothetical protein [Stellaceae bacterium]
MIVNLTHRSGDTVVLERIEAPVTFEGGQAQENVLVIFPLNGENVTARVVRVLPDDPSGEPAVEVALVNQTAIDAASAETLARLPPKDDFNTEL